jgi:hypothetical protein
MSRHLRVVAGGSVPGRGGCHGDETRAFRGTDRRSGAPAATPEPAAVGLLRPDGGPAPPDELIVTHADDVVVEVEVVHRRVLTPRGGGVFIVDD